MRILHSIKDAYLWYLSWNQRLSMALQGDITQKEYSWLEIYIIITNPLAWGITLALFVWHWQMRYRYGDQGLYLCMSKHSVVDKFEYFRIWTARMSHGSWAHLFGNVYAMFCVVDSIATHLNNRFIMPLTLVVLIWIISTPLHFAIASLNKSWSEQNVMGFSDVIFGLLSFEALAMYVSGRGFLELFQPFWLLIIIQFRAQNASFTGHLSGLLAGLIVYFGGAFLIFKSLPLMILIISGWSIAGAYFWSSRPQFSALARLGL